jgi:2-beta-glucuronyltransferase
MNFIAEELAGLGWQTDFVTTQLSLLSVLARVPRLKAVPRKKRNTWIDVGENLSAFVWVPVFHPATGGVKLVARMTAPLFRRYPDLLPEAVRQKAREAELVLVESCSAVALFPLLKKLAPRAKFVYRACDPLDAIGMHPILTEIERQTLADYDLVTSPSPTVLGAYPPSVKKSHVLQGLQKDLFDVPVPSPYDGDGIHAVVAGDMVFDRVSLATMVRNFPKITFHAFGRMDLRDLASHDNLISHGEVPFETLRDYIVHADLGIAPYLDRAELRYLAESSLKLVQYTYARLPILAPHFCKNGQDHVKGYDPGDEASIIAAVEQACKVDRNAIDRSEILNWQEIVTKMLADLGLAEQSRDAI